MGDERGIKVYTTPANLATFPGPLKTPRYAVVQSLGMALFVWTPGSVLTIDNAFVIASNGGAPGQWVRRDSDIPQSSIETGAATATLNALTRVDPTGGAFPLTLPDATGHVGVVFVKNVSDNVSPVTLTPVGGQLIDGAATAVLATARGQLAVKSDTTNWMIF